MDRKRNFLEKLKKSLDDNLYFFRGDYKEIITSIISENDVQAVYWNRSYDPYSIQRDKNLKSYLVEKGIEVKKSINNYIFPKFSKIAFHFLKQPPSKLPRSSYLVLKYPRLTFVNA